MTNLREIVEENDIVLIDTCFFSNIARYSFGNARLDVNRRYIKFINQVVQDIKGGAPIYVTSGVENEIRDFKHFKTKKKHNLVCQLTKTGDLKRKKLAKHGHVISMSPQNEHYKIFQEDSLDLKSRDELSEVDYDLLLTTIAISQEGYNSALLTGDKGIISSWNGILHRFPGLHDNNPAVYQSCARSINKSKRIFHIKDHPELI